MWLKETIGTKEKISKNIDFIINVYLEKKFFNLGLKNFEFEANCPAKLLVFFLVLALSA